MPAHYDEDNYPSNWHYKCSICGDVFAPEAIAKHYEEERAKPEWRGHMTWARVDDQEGNK